MFCPNCGNQINDGEIILMEQFRNKSNRVKRKRKNIKRF